MTAQEQLKEIFKLAEKLPDGPKKALEMIANLILTGTELTKQGELDKALIECYIPLVEMLTLFFMTSFIGKNLPLDPALKELLKEGRRNK